MKIVLLSNLLGTKGKALASAQGIHLNPSNQNFYQRIFESLKEIPGFLAITFSTLTGIEDEPNEPLHYINRPTSKLKRWGYEQKVLKTVMEKYSPLGKDDVLLYDALNVSFAHIASEFQKAGLKTIAICTDDPSNITGVPFLYPSVCKSASQDANGYLCLTDGLNTLFNKHNRPFMKSLGIIEPTQKYPAPVEGPYLYFGGALYDRYGVRALVEAYEFSKLSIPLYIAGHGPLSEVLQAKNGKTLHFLGEISKDKHLAYVSNATLCINPRCYDLGLDTVSVPSKVLEFLSNGKHILSTLSTPIKETYPNAINWIDGIDVQAELIHFFAEHFNQEGLPQNLVENTAQQQIQIDLGYTKFRENIVKFAKSLV